MMIKAGIVGGAGYTGGELIRLLLKHPCCQLTFVQSRSQQGKKVYEIHDDLIGDTELQFVNEIDPDVNVIFLCLEHGKSTQFIQTHSIPDSVLIIDLSQDFRIVSPSDRQFIYGLPEINRRQIKEAKSIANPGCFATAIQLAVLPLASAQMLNDEIHVSAVTGSSGAGQTLTPTSHFSWRDSNISVYKAFQHQHQKEIETTLKNIQPTWNSPLRFIPFRGNFTRGIFATVYTKCSLSFQEAVKLYNEFYQNHPFVTLADRSPSLKQVVNTNKCLLYLEKHEDLLLIVSMIDNLLKGASGQAVQNMNLVMGLDEKSGLELKSIAI